MDKQEAKLILSGYTLAAQPKGDSSYNEAIALLETDPELASWWEQQREADAAIRDSLQGFAVPNDLRAALRETLSDQTRKKVRFASMRRWMALAAVFMLSAVLWFQFGIDRSDEYQGPLAERAFNYSYDGPRLAYFNEDTSSLKTWLTDNGFSLPQTLPPQLLAQEGIGCRPLNWSDQRVALMCFNADTVYHLFIAKEKDFPDFEATEQFAFVPQKKGWTVSKWKDDEHLFVLSAQATPEEMSAYLAAYEPGKS